MSAKFPENGGEQFAIARPMSIVTDEVRRSSVSEDLTYTNHLAAY